MGITVGWVNEPGGVEGLRECQERATAMADPVFGVCWHLGESQGLAVWLENGIVSESSIAAFFSNDGSRADAFKDPDVRGASVYTLSRSGASR